MKKGKGIIVNSGRLFFILILAVLLVSSASAEINETVEKETVGKATVWLDSQVKGKLNTLSIDEVALSMLALSSDNEIMAEGKSVLMNKSVNGECWPSPLCKVKTTSLAVLALNRIGENTDKATAWLLKQEISYSTAEISWLLQLDSDSAVNCTISHDAKNYKISLNKDKTYSWIGTKSPCLTITDDYWLSVLSNQKVSTSYCRDKSYDIACERASSVKVIVSMPYKSGNILYVPSETFFAPTTIEIRTRCLKEGQSCNYDATLWGAYALQQTKEDYSLLLPYLIDLAPDNQKFMADAFLFIITTETSHAENLLSSQSKDGYWTDVGGSGKYYDTAIAYYAINTYNTANATKAKEWLIKNYQDGWGTDRKIRDTAMVLNFVWPSSKVVIPRNACEEDYTYSCRTQCLEGEEEAAFSCGTKAGKCCKPIGETPGCQELKDCLTRTCRGVTVTDATGKTGKCEFLSESICGDNFDNDNDGYIDALDSDCKETCLDKNGKICARNEECDEALIRTTDTDNCCIGTCVAATKTCSEQNGIDCEGKECKDDAGLGASDTFFCCSTECKSKTNILPFIIIALILALGAGAFFLYKKGFFRKKFVPPKIMPPSAGAYRPPVRPLTPQFPMTQQQQRPVDIRLKFQPQAQAQRPAFSEKAVPRKETKSELDETLKKLKKLAEEK